MNEGLRQQGYKPGDNIPSNFKQVWTDPKTNIKYEVRIHPADPKYDSGDIFRIGRKQPGVDAHGQGQGMEYLDKNGVWHQEKTLREFNKDGSKNPLFNEQAAKDTHMKKPTKSRS